eukprot:Skav218685  [mRNA]  locus=scaffold4775:11110:13471:+ [translate_table: standard]
MCLPLILGQIGARTNGRHILFFEFKILDENLEVVQDFRTEVTPEVSLRLRKSKDKTIRGSFEKLQPGEKYCVQVRVINAVGAPQSAGMCEMTGT